MEQDKHEVLDLSGGKVHGGIALAAGASGELVDAECLTRGVASTEPEGASAVDNAGRGASMESAKNEDPDEPLPESEGVAAVGNGVHVAASYSIKNEDDEVFNNPPATRFEFRATAANATPPSTYHRLPSRSRKQSDPTRFIAEGVPASAGAQAASDAPPPASLGSTLPSASPSGLHIAIRPALDATAAKVSSDAKDAAASSSSYCLPSRGRTHPDHFIPEEAEVRARAKAHRSSIVINRFLSSLVRGSSEPRPEWVKNVTADGVRGQRQRQRCMEGFKIRDVSHHAACVRGLRAAISRSEATSDPSSSARPGCALPSASASGGPEEPDESGTIFSVLAILGASLALSVVSCVLFYIVGQRTETGPSGEQQKK